MRIKSLWEAIFHTKTIHNQLSCEEVKVKVELRAVDMERRECAAIRLAICSRYLIENVYPSPKDSSGLTLEPRSRYLAI